jgi:hypothetical protein
MMAIFLQVVFVMSCFVLGYTMGYNEGKLDGRKAVRAYYDKRDKARV